MWIPNMPDTEISTKSPFIRYFLPTGGFMYKTVWDGAMNRCIVSYGLVYFIMDLIPDIR